MSFGIALLGLFVSATVFLYMRVITLTEERDRAQLVLSKIARRAHVDDWVHLEPPFQAIMRDAMGDYADVPYR